MLFRSGIQNTALQNFEVFPNPAQGMVYVTVKSEGSSQVSLLNLIGQTVRSYNVNSNVETFAMDIQGLKEGIYLVQVQSGNQISTKKLIIE